MPKLKKSPVFAAQAVTRSPPPVPRAQPPEEPPPATGEANARYAEYLRLLDELPVLLDVVSEPPRVVIRDFRLGQRPNARRAARDDAYAVREWHAGELAWSYAEYALQVRGGEDESAHPTTVSAAPVSKKKTKRSKNGKRSKLRKR